MKRLIQISIAILFGIQLYAQAPQKMSYQAVIRNSNNQLVANSAIGMRSSILRGSSSGMVVYSEIYNPNPVTNVNGLVTLEIGTGIPITGNFTTIDWANGPYFIKTETDPTGATNYTINSTKELISVPYALHAANSASYTEGQGINILNNKISLDDQNAQSGEVLKWSGTGWTPGSDIAGSNYNSGQGIDISNNTIALAKQNALTGQVLKWNGMAWTPGIDSNSTNYWSASGNNIFRNNGFVGIGNNNPAFPLDVRLARKNGIMRVMDVAVDTAHRSPLTVSYDSSAKSGIGLMVTAGKDPFHLNIDSLYIIADPQTQHVGILSAADDYGIIGTSELVGVQGYGTFGGSFYGGIGVECIGLEAGLLAVGSELGGDAAQFWGNTDIFNGSLNIFGSFSNYIDPVALHSETSENAGYFVQFGPSGNGNLVCTQLANKPNNGFLLVFNGANQEAGMYLDASNRGVVFADIKNFRMKYPDKPGKEIWYASVEGPEAAAYVRGTGSLVNGEATVVFTEDYQIVANSKTMTVILTPGSPNSKGLAAFEKTETGFKVKELFAGNGNYSFDWEVKCVRKGYEDYKVIRDEDETKVAEPKTTTRPVGQKLPNRLSRFVK